MLQNYLQMSCQGTFFFFFGQGTFNPCSQISKLIFISEKVKVKLLSRVRLFVTPWTAAYQAPPSMGFSRQEYWSGLPFPSPNFFFH